MQCSTVWCVVVCWWWTNNLTLPATVWLSRLPPNARLILGTHRGFGICTLAVCVVLLCWPPYVQCTGKSNPHLISMAALYHHRTGQREHGWGWDADSHQGPHQETTARGHREGTG